MYKYAIFVIAVGFIGYFGTKWCSLGIYNGLVKKEFDLGDGKIQGWAAIAIGLYSCVMLAGVLFVVLYFGWLLFR